MASFNFHGVARIVAEYRTAEGKHWVYLTVLEQCQYEDSGIRSRLTLFFNNGPHARAFAEAVNAANAASEAQAALADVLSRRALDAMKEPVSAEVF